MRNKEEYTLLPSDVLDFIKTNLSVVSDNDITVTLLLDGRSGAQVYRIKVRSRRDRLSGIYIVKIIHGDETREAINAGMLHQYVPEYSKHMVKVHAEQRLGDKSVIIYSQANNSVRDTVAYSKLDSERLAKYAEQTAYDLLNTVNREVSQNGTTDDFFDHLLHKQLADGSRFRERMASLIDNCNAQCVAINGNIYPNPLYFMVANRSWRDNISDAIILKGIIHGDLHRDNILATDSTYCIIDYDSVSTDSFLLFDQAYFEFSVFYDNSKNNDLKTWKTMLDRLITPSIINQASPCEEYMEYMVRNSMCSAITRWINDNHLVNMLDDIVLQFMMARIAAGINFFCKRSCSDAGKQLKVLLYIAYCLKLLLNKIGYVYNENDISTLQCFSEFTNTEGMWNSFVKYTHYISVLITDDAYTFDDDSNSLLGLCGINWSMVVDIGSEDADFVIYRLLLSNFKSKPVKKIDIVVGENVDTVNLTLNLLSARTSSAGGYRAHCKRILENLSKLFSENPQIPLVFVFDCSNNSLAFRNYLISRLCDYNLPGGTRFVALRMAFNSDLHEEMSTLQNSQKWYFIENIGTNLKHVAQTCKVYLNEAHNQERNAKLPSLNGVYTFSEGDLISYESCIELVYSGCELINSAQTAQTGFDMSGVGDSLGENFYKGNEATWSDIAYHRDLDLLETSKYNDVLEKLKKMLDENSPRVKTTVLPHGAGTGGTTLSKRILWDLKEHSPCARLKKYYPKAADILIEIYQKTGKSVLLSVEFGSSIITDDELNKLKKDVNAKNGKLVILLIKRVVNNNPVDSNNATSDFDDNSNFIMQPLSDTMQISIAQKFQKVFSAYAQNKEDSAERIELLAAITGHDKYVEQRSPFFYGFYAFQEEYNLLHSLSRTVNDCTKEERNLLNGLSLITYFSQNVCITFSELRSILYKGNESADDIVNMHLLMEKLPTALSKLIVVHENGLRICHKVIAEKILCILHANQTNKTEFRNVVFISATEYIQMMSEIYDYGNDRIDSVLKELIIDRAYIDAEERKTKFSKLVEMIPRWSDKKALFELLINKFPDNPHYYNHLARLLAFGDKDNNITPQYESAVEIAKTAIDKAVTSKATHRTTLGCIYGQWILNDIRSETSNRRRHLLSTNYFGLITSFSVRYNLAKSEFEQAREENTDKYDSFSYFPQINLECEIIKSLIAFDLERNLSQLICDERDFKEWYDEHFSIAVELTSMMKEIHCDNAILLNEAKVKLLEIANNDIDAVNRQLTTLLDSTTFADMQRRRSLTYSIFSMHNFNWSSINVETLQLAERCFRKNLLEYDNKHRQYDIETWFELYRRTANFNASEAQAMIADNMESGYRKTYILFLVSFIMHNNQELASPISSITRLVQETNRMARLQGLNTVRELDAYVGNNVSGCPIVPISSIPRNDQGTPVNLETFTGIVTEVEQTHGKILLTALNLEVTFIPNPLSVENDPVRTFGRGNIGDEVELNIMFSYSGLRGWNVRNLTKSYSE